MSRLSLLRISVALVCGCLFALAQPAYAQSGWGRGHNRGHNDGHGGGNRHHNNGGHNIFDDIIRGGWGRNNHHDDHHDDHHYYDDDNRYDNRSRQRVYRAPTNQAPAPPKVTVKANKVVQAPVKPKSNAGFSFTGKPVTSNQIEAWKVQTEERNAEIIDEFARRLPDDSQLASEINAVGGSYTTAEKIELLGAIKNGDSAALQFILDGGGDKKAIAKLKQRTDAFGALADLEAKANAGNLDDSDIAEFVTEFSTYVPPGKARVDADRRLADLMVNSDLMDLLDTASPGNGVIPVGNNSQIVWIPGLPPGTTIPLGNGAVMVGFGGPNSRMTITDGNAAQVAGFPIAIGPPLSDSKSTEVTSGVLLLNGGDEEVHYVVNNSQFSMQSNYTQTLPQGTIWQVKFDRGGSRGTATYKLTAGTYKFTPVADGWELYKHKFKTTIDNSDNSFEFRYVANNQHRTIAAKGDREHVHDYPLIVRFDNGDGTAKRKKLLGGVARVAVADDNRLELFDQESIAPPSQDLAPAPDARPIVTAFQKPGRRNGRVARGSRTSTSRRRVASEDAIDLFKVKR